MTNNLGMLIDIYAVLTRKRGIPLILWILDSTSVIEANKPITHPIHRTYIKLKNLLL